MRAAGGAVWAVGTRLGAQGVQFASGIVLARLLSPAEFGLMAAIYSITGLAVLVLDFGITAVVVRWAAPRQAELSTLFWLNLLNGCFFVGLVTALGPVIASFYKQPALAYLAPLASLSFLLSFGAVHAALLSRSGRFKEVSILTAMGGVVSTFATLVLALAGLGATALAVGPAVGALSTSVGLIAVSRWRPAFNFERAALTHVWRFSRGVVGAQSVEFVLQNADSVLLGRTWGPAVLGAYNRAFTLMLIPVNQITGAVGSVVYPTLAAMQDDRVRLQRAFESATQVIFLVVGFLVVQLALAAPLLIPLLYGDRWIASVVPLRWLCIAGLARVATLTTAWLLQVVGRTDTMFRLAVVEGVLTLTGIVIAVPHGADALAFAIAIAGLIYLPVNLLWVYRVCGFAPSRLWTGIARSMAAIGLAAAVAAGVTSLTSSMPQFPRLLVEGLLATAAFAGVATLTQRQLVLKTVRALRR